MNIKTERLIGHQMQLADVDLLNQMGTNQVLMATLGGVRTKEQTQEFLNSCIAHWQTYGFGLWLWKDSAGSFIGRAGLRHVVIDGKDEIELAYALMPEFWNQGFATEIGKKLADVAFTQLGIDSLISFTLITNTPSERVMQKIGFIFERYGDYKELPHVFYRLKKER